jgi:excisionase family DNA binding protein
MVDAQTRVCEAVDAMDLMTAQEVAAFARVGVGTVHRWVEKGLLRAAIVTPGGYKRFRREDVVSLLVPDGHDGEPQDVAV